LARRFHGFSCIFLWVLLGRRLAQLLVIGIYSTAFKPLAARATMIPKAEIVDPRALQKIIFLAL
jgi:hypothetical protein